MVHADAARPQRGAREDASQNRALNCDGSEARAASRGARRPNARLHSHTFRDAATRRAPSPLTSGRAARDARASGRGNAMAGSVYEGKTYDEAVRKGLEALRLTRAEAVITTVEEGKG